MTRSLATSERAIRHLESEKARLIRDITSARDLMHSLEVSKDDLKKQFTAVSMDNEQMNRTIEKIEMDKVGL